MSVFEATYSGNDGESKEKELETKIIEVKIAKRLLLNTNACSCDEQYEELDQLEQKYVDKLTRLKAEQRARIKQQFDNLQSELERAKESLGPEKETIKKQMQHLIALETELGQVKSHNESLGRSNETLEAEKQRLLKLESELAQVKSENKILRSEKQRLVGLEPELQQVKGENESLSFENETLQAEKQRSTRLESELKIGQSKIASLVNERETLLEELSTSRQNLSEVQDRLTVFEQVTAATQHRVLQESTNDKELPIKLSPCLQKHLSQEQQQPGTAASDALRELYSELTTTLDARIVAVNMYQRNALTIRELQSIQSLRGRLVEAAEALLNIILEQPDAVYLCFLNVLKDTDHQHVYQQLLHGGYRGYDDRSSHTTIIRSHYVFLLETLDVKFSGLVGQLYSDQVISAVERDDITAEQTSFRANEKLLSVISRKSPQQFQQFLDALDKCSHRHVRNVIIDRPVGKTIHTLPEGEPVYGIASLGDYVCILRRKDKEQVEVYAVTTFSLHHSLTVPNAGGFADMTSCEHFRCLYIADYIVECIHRLEVRNNATNANEWPVHDRPAGLSVTTDHNLLITCPTVRKIKHFTPCGDIVCETTFTGEVTNPWQTVQLSDGQMVVCHGGRNDSVHRVVLTNADGQQIVRSHGGHKGSDTDQYDLPRQLAVDSNGSVFVVEIFNRRVKVLSPTLDHVRDVIAGDQFKWMPRRACLDIARRRLYVADNEHKSGKYIVGRVVVFSV